MSQGDTMQKATHQTDIKSCPFFPPFTTINPQSCNQLSDNKSIYTKEHLQKTHFELSKVLAFQDQSLPPVIIPDPASCPYLAKYGYFHQPER